MTNELDQIAMSAALDRIRQLECETVPREVADQLATAINIALTCSDLEAHRDDLKNAFNAYRESGPPCPGCVDTEAAGPQSWRCLRHQLIDALARVTALEEALQRIATENPPLSEFPEHESWVNSDNTGDVLAAGITSGGAAAGDIARKALAAKP